MFKKSPCANHFSFPILKPLWEKDHPLIISIAFIIFAILVLPSYLTINTDSWIQIIIFVAIFWYSFETRQVKVSMLAQNELEQRPIIDLYLRAEKSDPKKIIGFSLRNIGKGVAYNVMVEPVRSKKYFHKLWFDQANQILAPDGDEKPLSTITETKSGGMVMLDVNGMLRGIEYESFAFFLIKYQSINGLYYYSLFKLYNQLPPGEQPMIEFVENKRGDISPIQAERICEKVSPKTTIYMPLTKRQSAQK